MKTPTQKYPRHRFTAETFLRIEQLHIAAGALFRRGTVHSFDLDGRRGARCREAAYRLQRRAFTLGMLALTSRELNRCCEIQTASKPPELPAPRSPIFHHA